MIPLTENSGIDVGSSMFEGNKGIGDRTTGVVVTMEFNVAIDDRSKCGNQINDLRRRRNTN